MRGAWYRLRDAASQTGAWRLTWLAPLSLVSSRYLVLEWSTSRPAPEPRFVSGLRRSEAGPGELDALAAMNPRWRRPLLEERLRTRERCFLWWAEASPVHCRWWTTEPVRLAYLGLRFVPRPGDLLSVEAYTPSRYRCRGHFSASLRWLLGWAPSQGASRVLLLVAAWNRPIRSAFVRVDGLHVVGSVRSLGLGPLRRFTGQGRVRVLEGRRFEVQPLAPR